MSLWLARLANIYASTKLPAVFCLPILSASSIYQQSGYRPFEAAPLCRIGSTTGNCVPSAFLSAGSGRREPSSMINREGNVTGALIILDWPQRPSLARFHILPLLIGASPAHPLRSLLMFRNRGS